MSRTPACSNTTQKVLGQNPEETEGTEILENAFDVRKLKEANKDSFPKYSLQNKDVWMLVKTVCNIFDSFNYFAF